MDCQVVTDTIPCGIAENAVSEIKNRHHLQVKEID